MTRVASDEPYKKLHVSRPIELTFVDDSGSEWLLEIEIETDPVPGSGTGDHIPVTLTPVYSEAEWSSPFEQRPYGFSAPRLIGMDMRVHTRRYRVTRQPSNVDLWR